MKFSDSKSLIEWLVLGAIISSTSFAAPHWVVAKTNGMTSLDSLLLPLQKKSGLPALVAAVVHGTNIVAAGAVGVRKVGDNAKVTLEDKFHIGSCTKSMTALLATILAEEGKLKLNLRVGDVFPQWNLPPEKSGITLEMLLRNRSGIGNTPPPELWSKAFQAIGKPEEQRESFLQGIMKEPLAAKPNEKFIYSNFGFALAGAMIETKIGVPWERLMREYIFRPMGMKRAGFGAPGRGDTVKEPSGHQKRDDHYEAMPAGDNPAAIGPAGAVHCSILDLARYAGCQLQVARGEVPELKPFAEFLYTPPEGSGYAGGWLVVERGWAGGKAITHAGSNTLFYTLIWIAPEKNFAFVVSTNASDPTGGTTSVAGNCDEVIVELIKKFLGEI